MSMYREYRGRHSFQGGDGGVENAAGAVNERFSATLRENFTNPKKNPSYTAAKMLRARGLQMYLLLYGPTKPNLQLIRLLTSDEVLKYVFLELLRLCKEIIADQGFAGGFMFPYGLIPRLLVAVLSATRRATG
jgi:hypothetical protein